MSTQSDWPYESKDPDDEATGVPSWECPEGICDCHPRVELDDPVQFSFLLCDDEARPMPGARCRVLYQGRVVNDDVPHADADGWLTATFHYSPRAVTIEWAPVGTPMESRYPYRRRFYVELDEARDDESMRRRLHNLGFSSQATMVENVSDFQRAFGYAEMTGRLDDIRADLIAFHDDGGVPSIDDAPDDDARNASPSFDPALGGGRGLDPVARKAKKPKKEKVDRKPPRKTKKPTGGARGAGVGTAAAPVLPVVVEVASLFAQPLTAHPRSRWAPHQAVIGATIELFDAAGAKVIADFTASNPKPITTDKGKAALALGKIRDGTYVLRLNPPSGHSLRTPTSGPIVDPEIRDTQLGPATPSDAFNDAPGHTRFRILELNVTMAGGKLAAVELVADMKHRAAAVAHGAVVRVSATKLLVDWKPDWIKGLFDHGPKAALPPLAFDQFIVLHQTTEATPGSTINLLLNPKTEGEIGAHYLVDVDGHVIKMFDERHNVFHAGHGFWHGLDSRPTSPGPMTSFNEASVGIENVHKSGPFAAQQMEGLIKLIDRIRTLTVVGTPISPHDVLGHGEFNLWPPAQRKVLGERRAECPGLDLDWPAIENAGHATRPIPGSVLQNSIDKTYDDFFVHHPASSLSSRGASKAAVTALQTTLSSLGYFVEVNGHYDAVTRGAVLVFQNRYFAGPARANERRGITPKEANLAVVLRMYEVLKARDGFQF